MVHFNISFNWESGGEESSIKAKNVVPTSKPILGGRNAEEWEFKYIVSLRRKDNPGQHSAAGTLVTDRWVLTARHPLINSFYDNTTGKLVITDAYKMMVVPKYFNDLRRSTRLRKYAAEKTFCHPLPDSPQVFVIDSDIGLIKLNKPIPLESASPYNFTVVKMIEKSSDVEWKQKIKIAGWGRFNLSFQRDSYKLLKADLQLFSADQCASHFPDFRKNEEICAYEPGISQCTGDSGGPGMLPKIGSPDLVQVGIMSYTEPNCR